MVPGLQWAWYSITSVIAWSQSNSGPPLLEICIRQDFSPSHQVHRWYACHNFRSHFNYHLITLHSVFHCTTGELQSLCNLHTWYRVFLFRSYSDGIFQTWYPKILWYSKTYFASCRVKQRQAWSWQRVWIQHHQRHCISILSDGRHWLWQQAPIFRQLVWSRVTSQEASEMEQNFGSFQTR